MKLGLLSVAACLALVLGTVSANVIGLDFGSDAMKVALVQPGSPLEIVTNFQSKRKTPTCITFYRGERMFGSDSYALMPRKPELSVAKAYRMLGRALGHPLVQEVTKQYFPHEMYTNETTGAATMKMEDTHYTPEELIAMLMQVRLCRQWGVVARRAVVSCCDYCGGVDSTSLSTPPPPHAPYHLPRPLPSAARQRHDAQLRRQGAHTARVPPPLPAPPLNPSLPHRPLSPPLIPSLPHRPLSPPLTPSLPHRPLAPPSVTAPAPRGDRRSSRTA